MGTKSMILSCFLIYINIICINGYHTYYLHQGDLITHTQEKDRFQIYCYIGKPKYVIHMWQAVTLQLDIKNDNYIIYEGSSQDEVLKEYKEHHSSWSLNLFSWKQKQYKLNPFNQSCIGIDSAELYKVYLNIIRVDYWKILRLIIGIFLFISAKKLSTNTAFYYISGVTLGICASFLILVYFISKAFPRKPAMYGIAIAGWTVGVYILQLLWENIRTILISYQVHLAWYTVITGIISFIVCYRMGPVTNERTHKIIQWSLQAAALTSIYFSSHFQEAAMGQIILLFIFYNFPKRWVTASKTRRKFPPRVTLLSNDEYYQEGVRETAKALDELKKYCTSPDCNQWKTVLKLKDSKRFASFVEGDSHLSNNEMLDYESSIVQNDYTDDEEYTDDET